MHTDAHAFVFHVEPGIDPVSGRDENPGDQVGGSQNDPGPPRMCMEPGT